MKEFEIQRGMKAVGDKTIPVREGGFRERISRAQRYEINTMLLYRIGGEKEWREGLMKNISTSGILLHAADSLPRDTFIEMKFALPIHLKGENAAEVLCRGSVVRSSHCEETGLAAMVAARISHSRFLRQPVRRNDALGYFGGETF
jgi:PilZ domain